MNPVYPIIDLHCDLLSYLDEEEGADAFNTEDLGCAIPHLMEGNVKIQVAAVYAAVGEGSSGCADRQVGQLHELLRSHEELLSGVSSGAEAEALLNSDKLGWIVSLERRQPGSVVRFWAQGVGQQGQRSLVVLDNVDEMRFFQSHHRFKRSHETLAGITLNLVVGKEGKETEGHDS